MQSQGSWFGQVMVKWNLFLALKREYKHDLCDETNKLPDNIFPLVKKKNTHTHTWSYNECDLNIMPSMYHLLRETASNLSVFFFLFHFQGLKNLPKAENLLFLSNGGVLAPLPKLFVLKAVPFCFFPENTKSKSIFP